MTLQEAKDEVARQYKIANWNEACAAHPSFAVVQMDNVAELYARSKWDEACEAQKQIDSDLLNDWEFGGRSQVHHFKDTSKPEFK